MKKVKQRPYTELQQAIIDGKVDTAKVSGNAISCLLRKAKELGDEKVVQLAEKIHQIKKQESRIRINERSKKAYHERKKTGFAWKPPRSKDYTERQKKIVSGEIPLEKALTRELLDISQKAKLGEDIELSERMLSLYYDRKAESAEKKRVREIERSRIIWSNGQQHFSCKGVLNKYELEMLDGEIPLSECSLEHLIHIRSICEKNNEVEHLKIAELLIEYKTNPDSLYIVTNHEDALDIIEKYLTYPLRRTNTWLK